MLADQLVEVVEPSQEPPGYWLAQVVTTCGPLLRYGAAGVCWGLLRCPITLTGISKRLLEASQGFIFYSHVCSLRGLCLLLYQSFIFP